MLPYLKNTRFASRRVRLGRFVVVSAFRLLRHSRNASKSTALIRQQVPYLLRREGFVSETPWWVLADRLEDRDTDGPHGTRREAALLRLAFAEVEVAET